MKKTIQLHLLQKLRLNRAIPHVTPCRADSFTFTFMRQKILLNTAKFITAEHSERTKPEPVCHFTHITFTRSTLKSPSHLRPVLKEFFRPRLTNFYDLLFPCAFCMSFHCYTPRCIHLKLWIIRHLTTNNSITFDLFTVCAT